jgi:hypothetical protein
MLKKKRPVICRTTLGAGFPAFLTLFLAALLLVLPGCTNLLNDGDTTYTVTANGAAGTTTSTAITFSFSAAVTGLTADNITVGKTGDTGSVTKGALTGADQTWTLALTSVTTAGNVMVSISKTGIESAEKTVAVYKAAGAPPASDTLNAGLIGTWQASGENDYGPWTDTYTITTGTGGEIGGITHDEGYTWTTAAIVYIYNFDAASGCLIVKYTTSGADRYNAVYFKDLSDTQVLLGDAWDASDENYDSSVTTLAEAVERFRPENAETYGGGDAQMGSPQTRDTDTHTLNSSLVGTFKASGAEWTDDYTVTTTSITHESSYQDAITTVTGSIEYIYNFSGTAGCIIIKYTANPDADLVGKYDAVYFKDLSADEVLLGSAWTVEDYTVPTSVPTLEEAKLRFRPENAADYGGGDAQTGTPQTKQP